VNGSGRILIVDSGEKPHGSLAEELIGLGYRVQTASSEQEALAMARLVPFDCVVTDYRLPESDCDRLITETRQCRPATQVIVVDAAADTQRYMEVMNEGAFDYFPPWTRREEVLSQIHRAVDVSQAGRSPS